MVYKEDMKFKRHLSPRDCQDSDVSAYYKLKRSIPNSQ